MEEMNLLSSEILGIWASYTSLSLQDALYHPQHHLNTHRDLTMCKDPEHSLIPKALCQMDQQPST